MSSAFIPQKIKVGFQNRDDTYTGRLAYVIYFDEKGKLRKETSWEGWRDKDIDPVEFDNVPTEGFVLNKKVGGYMTGWDMRNTYVRVYDPRNFEFEITIPNLLFILENTSSIKGKGLDGSFVYGWDGAELMLIPTDNPTYEGLKKINDLQFKKDFVKTKDLVIGATYLHKSNIPMVYMGLFDYYPMHWYHSEEKSKDKHHFFMSPDLNVFKDFESVNSHVKTYKTLGNNFLQVVDGTCSTAFTHILGTLECLPCYSPLSGEMGHLQYTWDQFSEEFSKEKNSFSFLVKKGNRWENTWVEVLKNGTYSLFHSRKDRIFGSLLDVFIGLKPAYDVQYLKNGNISKY